MLVRDVLLKYHKIVPFPWSIKKIKKANWDPTEFLMGFGVEIERCEDVNTPTVKELLLMLKKLKMF